MTSTVPSNNRDLPDPATGVAGNVPILQSNGTTSWGSNLPSGLSPLGSASTLLGMNLAGTSLEYKTLTSSDGVVTVTNTANNINLKAGLTTYSDTATTTLTAASTTHHISTNAGNKTFLMPLAATCPGKIITLTTTISGANLTATRQGSDLLGGTSFTTSFLFNRSWETASLVSDGVSRWTFLQAPFGSNISRSSALPLLQALPGVSTTSSAVTWTFNSSRAIQVLSTNSNTITVTIDTAQGFVEGKTGIFKRSGSNLATLTRSGADVFKYRDAASLTSFTLPSDGAWAIIQCTDAGIWHVITGSSDVLNQFGGDITTYTVTTTVTLDVGSTTKQIVNTASGNKTFNLPLASTCPGKRLEFWNMVSGAGMSLTRQGSDVIGGATFGNTTLNVNRSFEPVVLTSDGVSRWVVENSPLGDNMRRASAGAALLQAMTGQYTTSDFTFNTSAANIHVVDTIATPRIVTVDLTSNLTLSKIGMFKRMGGNLATFNRSGSETFRYKQSDTLTTFMLPSDGSWVILASTVLQGSWNIIDGSDDVLSQFGGSNSIAFTGTTTAMVAGVVTVTDSRVKTGDIIQATRVSGAGVSAGITSYSIVNVTSFTLNGVITDDGVYSYIVIRP